MKTWILVWFLISPTNEDGTVEWESGISEPMTYAECSDQIIEVGLSYTLMEREGVLAGHIISCKEVS